MQNRNLFTRTHGTTTPPRRHPPHLAPQLIYHHVVCMDSTDGVEGAHRLKNCDVTTWRLIIPPVTSLLPRFGAGGSRQEPVSSGGKFVLAVPLGPIVEREPSAVTPGVSYTKSSAVVRLSSRPPRTTSPGTSSLGDFAAAGWIFFSEHHEREREMILFWGGIHIFGFFVSPTVRWMVVPSVSALAALTSRHTRSVTPDRLLETDGKGEVLQWFRWVRILYCCTAPSTTERSCCGRKVARRRIF